MLWRQGDIFIENVPLIPGTAAPLTHLVLADGELTGHSHRVADPDTALLFESRGELFLQVIGRQANVIHQEHGTVTLPRGCYRVWRQREYDPGFSNPQRNWSEIATTWRTAARARSRAIPSQSPLERTTRWVLD